MDSQTAIIDGTKIHYQTSGSGPSTLLLIHGAVGSTNDFAIQMVDEKLGLSKEEFTLIAYDLPGFGLSEPLQNIKSEPTLEYFEMAAEVGAELMSSLNFKTYSVAGWSDGARVAALLASKHQSRVDGLILWGFMPVMDMESSKALARIRDTGIWDPEALKFYSSVYDGEMFAELWHHYVDFTLASLELPEAQRFDIRERLSSIKCPTLVLYGEQDPIVSFGNHVKPLSMQIFDSDIKVFKSCAHNIHQADPANFNQELTMFVTGLRV